MIGAPLTIAPRSSGGGTGMIRDLFHVDREHLNLRLAAGVGCRRPQACTESNRREMARGWTQGLLRGRAVGASQSEPLDILLGKEIVLATRLLRVLTKARSCRVGQG